MHGMTRNRRVAVVVDIRRTIAGLLIAFARCLLRGILWCLRAGLIGRPATRRAFRRIAKLNGVALRLAWGSRTDH
jgi:hypothetical protein